MDYDQLLLLAASTEGEPIETTRGQRFRVRVGGRRIYFTPQRSSVERSDREAVTARFLTRFANTGSLRPSDYADLTRNGSYYIGLILFDRRRAAEQRDPTTHCMRCGRPRRPGALFCRGCGNRFAEQARPVTQRRSRRSLLEWLNRMFPG